LRRRQTQPLSLFAFESRIAIHVNDHNATIKLVHYQQMLQEAEAFSESI